MQPLRARLPDGIDIRQGLQMECIGCTACIDACDDVMTRLHRPRGLIRYDSQDGFTSQRTLWLRPRTILYFVLLLIGAAVLLRALSTVKPANLGVTRMTGAPYIVDATAIRNQFLVRIVNKRNAPARFVLSLDRQRRSPPDRLHSTVEVAPLVNWCSRWCSSNHGADTAGRSTLWCGSRMAPGNSSCSGRSSFSARRRACCAKRRKRSVPARSAKNKPSRLWLWAVAAFVLQAAAWTAWFVIASHNKVQEVPLVRSR